MSTKKSTSRKPRAKKAKAVAHPALHGIATRVRSGNNGAGKPCGKHKLFALYIAGKLPTGAALEKFARENKIKPSTIRSWLSNWNSGLSADKKTGAFIPPQAQEASVLKAYKREQAKA